MRGFYPTVTGIFAYVLGTYFFIYFEWQAWNYWREERLIPLDRRVPQRKWISCALGLVCANIALPAAIMNGTIQPSAFDYFRTLLVAVGIWLFVAVYRVEDRDKHRANRRLTTDELEQWRREHKEYLAQLEARRQEQR